MFILLVHTGDLAAPPMQDPRSSSTQMRFTALHVAVILVAILLCVIICAIPWDNLKCGKSSAGSESGGENQQQQENPVATTVDEEDGRQTGLTKKVIKSFELVRYGISSLRDKAESEGTGGCWSECMICLCEFRNGQRIRVLPHCGHGFHKKCIDQWLLSHNSCPICRHALVLYFGFEKPQTLPREDENVGHGRHGEEDDQSTVYRDYVVISD